MKRRRDPRVVAEALSHVREAARSSENLVPPILEAVKRDVTLGEICDVFREVFGVFRDPAYY